MFHAVLSPCAPPRQGTALSLCPTQLACQQSGVREALPAAMASQPPPSPWFPDPNEALIFSEPAASIPVPSDLVSRLMDGARRASHAAWAIKHCTDKSSLGWVDSGEAGDSPVQGRSSDWHVTSRSWTALDTRLEP